MLACFLSFFLVVLLVTRLRPCNAFYLYVRILTARNRSQDLQKTAMEKTHQLELALRDAQSATHRATMAEHELTAVLRSTGPEVFAGAATKAEGRASRVRDEAALIGRVQAASHALRSPRQTISDCGTASGRACTTAAFAPQAAARARC